ncbi:MAG: hypothetical protein AAFX06_28340 [Planctomycetota bacterium]
MRNMRHGLAVLCILFVGVAEAQRPNPGGRNNARGPKGNRGALNNGALNNGGFNNGAFNNGMNAANQAGMQNRFGNQGGRNPNQLAQTLITNFDSDGNGALDVNELIQALQGLRQMMQAGGGQAMQAGGGQQQGFGEDQNRNAGQRQFGQRGGPPGQNNAGRAGGNRGQRGRGPR